MDKDPLADLFIDAGAVDRQAIAEALKEIVGIDTESHRVVTKPGFGKLAPRQQLVAVLLGVKAAHLLGLIEKDGAQPSEVVAASGMPPGTVRRGLRELLETRLLSQDSGGRYLVAHQQVPGAIAALSSTPSGGGGRTRRGRDSSKKPVSEASSDAHKTKTASPAPARKVGARRRPKSDGLSPKVRDLLEKGFFDSPKTLAEIQAHLKRRMGIVTDVRYISPIMLRLLRAGEVDRDENADGIYQYVKSRA